MDRDPQLVQTEKLTLATSAIRPCRDGVQKTLAAWSSFESRHANAFAINGTLALKSRWEGHLDTIRGHISELQDLHLVLAQKLEQFDALRNGVRSCGTRYLKGERSPKSA